MSDRMKLICYVKDDPNKRKTVTPQDKTCDTSFHTSHGDSIKVFEEIDQADLLIERQDHHCEFKIAPEDKARSVGMAREEHLRDYRFVHGGLIEAALSQLQPSRPREIDSIKQIIDYSPISNKYADMDEADFDFFENDDGPDEPTEPGLTKGSSKAPRPSNFEEGSQGKPPMDENHLNLPDTGPLNLNLSSAEDSSVEEEQPDKDENKPKKATSPIKRKDSGGGLFGIAEWDSDEDDIPVKKAFSFIDTNLDKFNVLNFIENQEHKVAPN